MAKPATKPAQYDAGQIQVLKGLEAVRKRPGMYIGSTSERGLHHLVYEVVDNSIDEALVGYADRIEVTIHADNSITVVDNGRGIPVDIHPTEKIPGVELALTMLHAGGKFDKSSYKVSGGLHGVGVCVVNALSEQLKVWVKRGGQEHYMDFVRGVTTTKLKSLRTVPKSETGTTVWFKPDATIFTALEYNFDTLATRLRELSFLNKGITILFTDERGTEPRVETFHAKGGLKEFVAYLNTSRKPLHADVDLHRDRARRHPDRGRAAVQRGVQRERLLLREQHQHARGRHASHRLQERAHARDQPVRAEGRLPQAADFTLTGDDVREGLTGVLSVKVREPQFEGQTKTKLGNSEVESAVKTVVNEFLAAYLEEHPPLGEHRGGEGGECGARARGGAEGARPRAQEVGARRRRTCRASSPTARSAIPRCARSTWSRATRPAAPRSRGATREFQAILPLRGKILNVEKARIDKVLSNEEIRTMITALGAGIKEEFDLDLRALPQDHHHDRRRRGRRAHPHAAAHVLLPPDAGADRRGLRLHRAAAALPRGARARTSSTPTTTTSATAS